MRSPPGEPGADGEAGVVGPGVDRASIYPRARSRMPTIPWPLPPPLPVAPGALTTSKSIPSGW